MTTENSKNTATKKKAKDELKKPASSDPKLAKKMEKFANTEAKKEKLKPIKEILLKEQQAIEEFKDNPLVNMLSLLIKEHTGTEREQKTTLTGLLYILRIMAMKDRSGILKVIGKSSAGKSHLVKTLLNLIPPEWIKEVGDMSTNAIKYIEWDKERILYIKEGSGSEKSTETLKLMDSGDGGFTALVTRGNPSEGFYVEEISIPVKFIITTSAKNIFDNELDNRMFGISIDESDEQTFLIMYHRCKDFAGHLSKVSYAIAQKVISTLSEFDEIIVPYSYEFLNILHKKIRARRDIDKLLSLCQTSAFINQHNRPIFEKDGKKILYATPEDAYNVFTLAFSSFEETVSGLMHRMEKIYDAIPTDDEVTHKGVTYKELMKITGYDYKAQIIREVEKLDNLGLVDIDTSSNKHTITRTGDIKKMKRDFEKNKLNFLAYTLTDIAVNFGKCEIPISWIDIGEEINRNKNRNKVKQEIESLQENRNKNRNKTVTKQTDFYKNDELEQYFGDGKNVKTVTSCYGLVTLNVTVTQQKKNSPKTVSVTSVTRGSRKAKNGKIINLNLDDDSTAPCYDVIVSKKSPYSKTEEIWIRQTIEDNPDDNYEQLSSKIGDDGVQNGVEAGILKEVYMGKKYEYVGEN